MKIAKLKELLDIFPDDMEVFIQTCEGDLLSPLNINQLWMIDAQLNEFKNLQQPFLVITSFVEGKERLDYKNKHSGIKYITKPITKGKTDE